MMGRQDCRGMRARTWEEAAKTAAGRQRKIKEGFFLSFPLSFHLSLPLPPLDKEALLLFAGGRCKEPVGETKAAADKG